MYISCNRENIGVYYYIKRANSPAFDVFILKLSQVFGPNLAPLRRASVNGNVRFKVTLKSLSWLILTTVWDMGENDDRTIVTSSLTRSMTNVNIIG